MVMHLSCCLLGLSMPEAIAAATINAAASLGMAEDYGSIEVGKWGDFILLDAPRFVVILNAIIIENVDMYYIVIIASCL